MRLLFTIIALLTSLSATTLTGTFKSASGDRVNGTLTLTLSYPGVDTTPSPDESLTQEPIPYKIVNGTISGINTIIGNDVIEPKNTVYYGVLRNAFGTAVRYGNYYISGSSYNIGAAIPTATTTQNVSFQTPVTSSSTTSFSNKTLDCSVGSNICTISEKKLWVAAQCSNATPLLGANYNLPTTNIPTPLCGGPGNPKIGALSFTNAGNQTASIDYLLPSDWSGNIDFKLIWWSGFTTGTVTWQLDAGCVTPSGTTAFGSQTFTNIWSPTAQAPDPQVSAPVARTVTNVNLASITGCTAGDLLIIRVKRIDADATNTTALLWALEATVRRAI